MIATSGFLSASECTIFIFGRGSAPDPTGGACKQRSHRPYTGLADLMGSTSKG